MANSIIGTNSKGFKADFKVGGFEMTKEELKEHCEKQVKACEMWAENRGQEPSGKIYEEHKLILDLIKALEQQTINCNATIEEIAQSFKADIEAVKDYLPKCNSMEFPKTFDEFANDYGFTDDKEIYTNCSHLIPVFRVKQWLDHIEQQPTSDDCVSREDVKQFVEYIQSIKDSHNTKGTPINFGTICDLVIRGWKLMDLPPVTPKIPTSEDCVSRQAVDKLCIRYLKTPTDENVRFYEEFCSLPPVTPTHGTCKDCKHINCEHHEETCDTDEYNPNFYCKDFKKRGNENG